MILCYLISCCTNNICQHDGVPTDVGMDERAASSVVPIIHLIVKMVKCSQGTRSVCSVPDEKYARSRAGANLGLFGK